MKMLEKAVEDIRRIGRVNKRDFRDEIVACFATDKEVIVNESQNTGYDYIAYVNEVGSRQILMTVLELEDEIEILNVWIA